MIHYGIYHSNFKNWCFSHTVSKCWNLKISYTSAIARFNMKHCFYYTYFMYLLTFQKRVEMNWNSYIVYSRMEEFCVVSDLNSNFKVWFQVKYLMISVSLALKQGLLNCILLDCTHVARTIFTSGLISIQFSKYLLNRNCMPTMMLVTGMWKSKDESIISDIRIRPMVGTQISLYYLTMVKKRFQNVPSLICMKGRNIKAEYFKWND